MYPPPEYARLPNDEEFADNPQPTPVWYRKRHSLRNLVTCQIPRRRLLFLVLVAGATVTLFVIAVVLIVRTRHRPAFNSPPVGHAPVVWPPDALNITGPRPSFFNSSPERPLVLRIAVITRVGGFERRSALRDAMFQGVKSSDVQLEYKFFLGAAPNTVNGLAIRQHVKREMQEFGDIIYLDQIPDIQDRISEKRYAALKWGSSISSSSYDYFMTLDSDTFCRLGALARRLPHILTGKNTVGNPREQPVLIGMMGSHLMYWKNIVPDGNEDPNDEDEYMQGPWYAYPSGIGYMLSSSLTSTLASISSPTIAHHVHYPWDDVMIGSWIAGLLHLPSQGKNNVEFKSTDHSPEPIHVVHPKPYYPDPIDTKIIDDKLGWHDYWERGWHPQPLTWESICIHRLGVDEMRNFRQWENWNGEWEDEKHRH